MKISTLALSCLLIGCATVRPIIREAELMVYPRFGPHSQALGVPITLSNIATLDIIPYVEDTPGVFAPISATTGNPTAPEDPTVLKLTQASPSIDPNRPFVLRKLKPNKTYRVYGKAYSSSNFLISKDTDSYVEVAIGNNDAPTMASLPVQLIDTPFGASTSITINTDGRFDYLKTTLYLISNNAQVAVGQTTRNTPTLNFTNLQGNSSYKLVAEAYKSGAVAASNSVNIDIGMDDSPATSSLSLTIPYVVTTLAGQAGVSGYSNGAGTQAKFYYPRSIAVDAAGNVYMADSGNNLIRKITSDGVVSAFAGGLGTTQFGIADGTGTSATLKSPYGITASLDGTLFLAERGSHRIRKITSDGIVTKFAGQAATAGYANGMGSVALFNYPEGIAVDTSGNLYVTDTTNNCIRKVASDTTVSTFAGSTSAGFVNGAGTVAQFNAPRAIVIDTAGNLYVADSNNNLIRKITSDGTVSTFAGGGGTNTQGTSNGIGTAAKFNSPHALTIDAAGNVYVADTNNLRIRKITPNGVVTTLAGNGTTSNADGTGLAATFSGPRGIAVDGQGILYVSDYTSHLIRVLK